MKIDRFSERSARIGHGVTRRGLTVAASLVLVAAACSTGTGSPTPTQVASTAGTATPAPSTATPVEPVELVLWDPLIAGADVARGTPKSDWFMTKAIGRFEIENAGITVKLVDDTTEFPARFRAASIAKNAKNGPDIVTLYPGGDISSYADFLRPLDSDFTAAEQEPLTGWDLVRQDMKKDGTLLGVPFGAGQYFQVFYNKALVGSDFVSPATWEELITSAETLKAAGTTPFVVGEGEGFTGAWVMAKLVGAAIGTDGFLEMRSGTRSIEDPAMVAGYENYAKLFARGLTNKDAGSKIYTEAKQDFINGSAAMFISGSWDFGELTTGLGDKLAFFPIPGPVGSPLRDAIPGAPSIAFAVTNYSGHQDAAVKFLKFMIQADLLDSYVATAQVEASNHRDAAVDAITNPLLRQQAELLKANSIIIPFDSIMPAEVNTEFYRQNTAVFTGGTSPLDAATTLQATLQSVAK